MNPRNTVLGAFIEHEWATQRRSPRFVAVASVYVLLSVAPPWSLFRFNQVFVTVRDLAEVTIASLPALTLLMAAALSYDAISREHNANAYQVMGLTPISSAGYLLRRWVAIVVLILPLTLAGPISGIVATYYSGTPVSSLSIFLNPWIVHIVPLILFSSAIALAAGTMARSLVGAGILLLILLNVAFRSVSWIFEKLGATLPYNDSFLGLEDGSWIRFIEGVISGQPRWEGGFQGSSLPALFDALLPQAVIPLGVGFLLLSLAPSYLSRTRSDLEPMRIRDDHPLRSYLRQWNRLRVSVRPDALRSRPERGLPIAALLLLAAAVFYCTVREKSFVSQGESRYRMLTSAVPNPTPPELIAEHASLTGNVGKGRRVSTQGVIRFRNSGNRPIDHIAMTVDSTMTIEHLRVNGVPFEWTRLLSRLHGTLPAPVGPGETVNLEFRLVGSPYETHFVWQTRYRRYAQSFATYWEARYPFWSMGNSYRNPSVDPVLTVLSPETLIPIPRYETWKLTAPPQTSDEIGRRVPEETRLVDTPIEIDFKGPFEMVDACGDMSANGRLRGVCRTPLQSFSIVGGKLSLIETGSSLIVALEDFEHLAREHQTALDGVADEALQGWGDILDQERPIWLITGQPAVGAFINIPIWTLRYREMFRAESLSQTLLAQRLIRERAVRREEGPFFLAFYRTLGAVPSEASLPRPLLDRTAPIDSEPWRAERQLGPLLSWLSYRVGSNNLREGVKSFVSEQGSGTARELFESIARVSGEPLGDYYDDYISGLDLPRLELGPVEADRNPSGWTVRGTVLNSGTGEAVCPLVLVTEVDEIEREVTVGEGEEAIFRLETNHRPRSVLIDPARRCYRLAGAGLVMRRDIE